MLGLSHRPLTYGKRIVDARLPLHNGFEIPQLGFGTYRIPSAEVKSAVKAAVDLDYRHIDCAKAYLNQTEIGKALKEVLQRRDPKKRRILREDLFITSKLWPTDQHPDHVEAACRETLQELQLDYLDLYLVHWPVCWRHSTRFDTDADKYPKDASGAPAVEASVTLRDTWRAMSALVDKGLVRSIGLSNCNEEQVQLVLDTEGCHLPVLNQVECHPLLKNRALSNYHGANQIVTGAYCPLCPPTRFTPPDFKGLTEQVDIVRLAEHCGMTPQRLLLCWNADYNHVVVVKSTNPEHMKSNAKAGRQALDAPARAVLDNMEEIIGRMRVMNPVGYVKTGEPFFR